MKHLMLLKTWRVLVFCFPGMSFSVKILNPRICCLACVIHEQEIRIAIKVRCKEVAKDQAMKSRQPVFEV